MKILIIDDTISSCKFLSEMIPQFIKDVKIKYISSWDEAQKITENFDVMLIDWILNGPTHTGYLLAQQFKPAYPETKIILMSANGKMPRDEDNILHDYWVKNDGVNALIKIISRPMDAEIISDNGEMLGLQGEMYELQKALVSFAETIKQEIKDGFNQLFKDHTSKIISGIMKNFVTVCIVSGALSTWITVLILIGKLLYEHIDKLY